MRKISVLLSLAFLAVVLFFSCKTEETADWKNNDNTVRVRQSVAIKTLNPYLYRYGTEATAFELIFQYLLGFNPENLEMTPELVKLAPEVANISEGEFAGGQSFTYEIHEEAKWDDGTPVTGHDYVFSVKILFHPKLPMQRFLPYISAIGDIAVDEENPKRFTVFTTNQYFLSEAGVSNLIVLPKHIYDSDGLLDDFALRDFIDREKAQAMTDERLQQFADAYQSPKFSREVVSGSGPYKLVEWVEDQRVVLAKKENWWGDKIASDSYPMLIARPDTIIFLPIPDQTAAMAALNNENVDVAFELDPKQFNDFRATDFAKGIYNFFTPPRFVYYFTTMNNQNPKLSDKRVRRAIAHTLDVDAVIADLYDGLAERQTGPFLPEKPYYDKSLAPIEMDLDKARQLLAAAGWEDSNGNGIVDKEIDGQLTELELTYLYTPSSNFQNNLFQLQQANAKKIGIEIKGEQLESNVKVQRLRNGDYEITGHGAGAQPVQDDPRQLWHTDGAVPGGSNYPRFGNAESDKLVEAIGNAETEEERFRLYKEFQKLIYDEQPVVFLFSPQEKIVVHQRFGNVISSRKAPGVSLQHLELKGN